jgi:hydroxymethylpyrimidine pyrophosphatase-like HAD family hydrolase
VTSCRLLALDLDGTLLRDDGGVAGEDQAAIAEARARGIVVTIATGRLPASTLPHARALDLDAPLVCADGAVIINAKDEAVTRTRPLSEEICERVSTLGRNAGLPTFFLTPDALLARPSDLDGQGLASLRGFTENVQTLQGSLKEAVLNASRGGRPIIAGFLVGDIDQIQQAADLVRIEQQKRPIAEVEPEVFPVGDGGLWAVRVRATSSTKGAGLAAVCAARGIAASHVATIGDWYNDMSMFAWAGQSFVMAGAPEEVARVAQTRLAAKAGQGGGVAEAVACILGGHSPG